MKIKLSSRVIHVVYVCCYFRSCHLYCFGSVRIVLFYLLLHSKHSFHLKYFLFALNCSKIEFYYKWIRNEKLPFSILEHFANWDSYGRWSDASKTSCHTFFFSRATVIDKRRSWKRKCVLSFCHRKILHCETQFGILQKCLKRKQSETVIGIINGG